MKITEAAALLGCKPAEVARVDSAPAGEVIVTTDGVSYVMVPDDTPDGEGKTGLMLLSAPSEKPVKVVDGRSMWNSVPLYKMPDDDVIDDTGGDADQAAEHVATNGSESKTAELEAEIREDLEGRPIDELRELARSNDVDVPMGRKAPIVAALVAHLTATPEGDS